MSSIYDWSLLAASNANSDDNINWAEGQPPSSVNNSARAMMQRVRELVSDLGAIAKTEGTANVLTFNAKSQFAAYTDGIRVVVRASNTNTGAATLNVNSTGAKPVFSAGFNGVVAIAAGQIQAGGIYEFIYISSLSDGAGGWMLLNPTLTQVIASGIVFQVAAPIVPAGYLYCNGQAVSRSQYANLFNAIGVRWGAGDGSTTFNVPDFRGAFLRGWDDGRGLDSGRVFASYQDSDNKDHGHTGWTGGAGGHDHEFSLFGMSDSDHANNPTLGANGTSRVWTRRTSWVGDHTHAVGIANSGGTEARPKNYALHYIIKV